MSEMNYAGFDRPHQGHRAHRRRGDGGPFTTTVAMSLPSPTSVVDSLNGAVAPLCAASAVLRTDGQNYVSSVEI